MTVNNTIIIFIAAAMALVSGCQPPAVRPGDKITCPGKPSIEEAIKVLSLQRQNVQPFRASAECVITYRDKDGRNRHEPIRGAQIAFVPDDNIYFRGELLFKELRFGTNKTQFWFRVKADLDAFGDSYWWGLKENINRCPETLPVHPGSIAEAFGVVEVTPDWKLFYRDGYDILSYYESGRIKKRIYINTCDYRIERIEYFDKDELTRVSVKLSVYSAQEDGIMTPTHIEVISYDRSGLPELTVSFKLKHIRPLPPEKQNHKKALFARPDRDGYEHVYQLNENCEFIEEPND